MKNRVMVLGIDGGTWKIIEPLVRQGKLPNIGKIIEGGATSPLHTTIPSQTVPAWPACFTGVNPGKLGVFHFMSDPHRDYDEGRTLTMNDLKVKTVWDYATENGMTAMSIFVPFTYPPARINGAVVTPVRILRDLGKAELMTWPEDLYGELEKVLAIDIATMAEQKARIEKLKAEFEKTNKAVALERTKNLYLLTTEKIGEGALYLMDRHRDWDFLMLVFTPIDTLQHRFWRFMDPAHPAHDPALAERFGEAITNGYMSVDRAIGKILGKAGENASVFIVSDHGIAPVSRWFNLNVFLKEAGYLKTRDVPQRRLRMRRFAVQKVLGKLGLRTLSGLLPQGVRRLEVPIPRYEKRPISELIDWGSTRAYATSFGINVNLKGREPEGAVPREGYRDVIEGIRKELLRVKDPGTGRKIFSSVFTKEELYTGPYVDGAPDLQFLLADESCMFSKSLDHGSVFKDMGRDFAISAHHINSDECTFNAIFMASGRHIKHTRLTRPPRIMDIVPTALYLMGLPVPEDLDGRVLTEIIGDEHLRANPVRYEKIDIYRERTGPGLTREEEDRIKAELKNLGYIE